MLLVAGAVGLVVVSEPPTGVQARAVSAGRFRTTTTTAPPTTLVPPPPPPVAAEPAPQPAAGIRGARGPARPARGLEPIVEIGTIEIPKIGLRSPIFHGATMRNINLGPSHFPGTAYPGEPGNAVFPGHRVTNTRPFRNIHLLAPGDEIIFTIDTGRWVYRVSGSRVVTPNQVEIMNPTPTPTATIFACHPPGSARYRYVVFADLVT